MSEKAPDPRDEFRVRVGQRLDAARIAIGFSFGDLASRTSISRGKLGDYFSGRTEPSLWVVARLAPVLEVDLYELLGIAAPVPRI